MKRFIVTAKWTFTGSITVEAANAEAAKVQGEQAPLGYFSEVATMDSFEITEVQEDKGGRDEPATFPPDILPI
jgi:hypothetical protein